ncbi:MAG: hypothetical protein JKY48_10825 [Flavobacteriales bacterium]|nr:hypothetical protein [Flavobacteriales bacterium]
MLKQITLIDLSISFFYVLVILFIVNITKPSKREKYTTYYTTFFGLKIVYALLFVLIHSYYYKGGDTFLYFSGGNFFLEQMIADPFNSIKTLSSSYTELSELSYSNGYSIIGSIRSSDVFFLSKIISIILLFTGDNYLAASIIYTLITAIGIWKLYATLCKLYPAIYKHFAIGILFYPSLGIWGSGILKDPLTFAAVGFIFSAVYNLMNREKLFASIISISVSTYLCFILKPYILYTFVPVMLMWVQGKIVSKTSSSLGKYILAPILIPIFIGGGYLFLQQISTGAGKYSLENVQSVAEGFHSWHSYLAETRDQSGYSLGNVSFTPLGILVKAPEAFFVTYFRPFIVGDVRNVATLFEALQAFALLIISLRVFFKVGIFKSFRLFVSNPDVRAFLTFAIILGVTVGLTSYNFGALSRYKIPGVPFYIASLAIIYFKGTKNPLNGK